jgi:hypothetical protein
MYPQLYIIQCFLKSLQLVIYSFIDGPHNVTIHYSSDTEELWEGSGKIIITCSAQCFIWQCNYRMYHNRRLVSSQRTYEIAMNRGNSGEYYCRAIQLMIRNCTKFSRTINLDIKCTFSINNYLQYTYVMKNLFIHLYSFTCIYISFINFLDQYIQI